MIFLMYERAWLDFSFTPPPPPPPPPVFLRLSQLKFFCGAIENKAIQACDSTLCLTLCMLLNSLKNRNLMKHLKIFLYV